MNLVNELPAHFGITEFSEDASGVTWFTNGNLDLRELAKFMGQAGVRFVTITANELPRGEGFCLEYIWDLDGRLFGFKFHPADRTMPSIFDICEAADWIEREIHEEYALDFTGREYEPLLLRAGDQPGVNLQEVAK
jgi:Ni,Fe-hydrogenase III component G